MTYPHDRHNALIGFVIDQQLCHWTGKPKTECGCTSICPNCGRRRHDRTKPACYLC